MSRKVIYPKLEVRIYEKKEAVTAELARELLGWQEAAKEEELGGESLLEIKRLVGKHVHCAHNINNRPIYRSQLEKICQDILQGHWQLNMENIIIGQTGLVLNGQHRLIGLVLAAKAWRKAKEDYPHWKREPSLETSIAFGVKETEELINTIDTCKARTLNDVIFRSNIFKDTVRQDRKALSRICHFAVRTLGTRIGRGNLFDVGVPETHPVLMELLERHSKLIECAKHVYEEDGREGRLAQYPAGWDH